MIYSRNGHDFTERFLSIAQLLHDLPAEVAVLDGEVVANDADGLPNFARLHVRWTRPYTVYLWAFDLRAFNPRSASAAAGEASGAAADPCWSASAAQPPHCLNHSKTAWRCCAWPRNAASRAW